MNRKLIVFGLALVSASFIALTSDSPAGVDHIMGEMAGEVTTSSVILQSRLTAAAMDRKGDVPGARGAARFEVADNPDFKNAILTRWLEAEPKRDYIIKVKVAGLKSGTLYHYRLIYGPESVNTKTGPARTFRTLPGAGVSTPVNFVVVTGMNYGKFQRGNKAYEGPDKALGFPGLVAIKDLKPDFFVGTGDNVYYDYLPKATTEAELRKKYHEQWVQPRYIDLFAEVPTYWEKDDHDFRYNDSDNTGRKRPLPELGKRLFREQLPVTDPDDPAALTYRTHRISRDLQIWLLEGRDYRSPNNMPDGPEKSIWGKEQREWLKKTLLASDAAFKIIISPTALIGPDDGYKKDNHCNIGGFQYERDEFFAWLDENGFRDKGLYFVCGDRHWQYHSIHPSGFEEFSCGALVDANSRMGVKPGDRLGTDPKAEIKQPYTSPEASGGFLQIKVQPGRNENPPGIEFRFFDEKGELLYSVGRTPAEK